MIMLERESLFKINNESIVTPLEKPVTAFPGRFVDRFAFLPRRILPQPLVRGIAAVGLVVGMLGTASCTDTESTIVPSIVSENPIIDVLDSGMEWFNGLESKQKAAVFIYGLSSLYFLRFLKRSSQAMIETKGNFKERVAGAIDAQVSDGQNYRSIMGLSAFTTSSIIHFVDSGQVGSLEVNVSILSVALIAALLPSWLSLDREKEKRHAEVIQKIAPSVAGALIGIVESGFYFNSDQISALQAYLGILAFGGLYAFADMGAGSREYFNAYLDPLNIPESLRRFHALLISKRLPVLDRNIFQALVENRARDTIFNGTVKLDKKGRPMLDQDGRIMRNEPLIDEVFKQLEIVFKKDNKEAELDIPLSELKEQVIKAIEEFMQEDHQPNVSQSRHRRRKKRRKLLGGRR